MLSTSPARQGIAALILVSFTLTGCPIARNSVPPHCVIGPRAYDAPKASKEPLNFVLLRQDPPDVYLLGPDDVLGIYIERILGQPEIAPPVHYPEGGDLPPAVGYPIPVRADGTISLPMVPPVPAEGLTLAQVERLIKAAYTIDKELLIQGEERIMVTLIKPRNYSVLVIREDTATSRNVAEGERSGELTLGRSKRGQTYALELDAYENDVLHALAEGGGLPGLDAKNEVTILRGAFRDAQNVNPTIRAYIEDPGVGGLSPEGLSNVLTTNPNVTKIPLRLGPGDPPLNITQEDIILNDGDIVFIESRDAEVFYTGGLLAGGQFPIPRDYDLDVLGAIAMAGGSIASGSGYSSGGRGGTGANGSIIPPTRITVVRQTNHQQMIVRINAKKALLDPQARILIQPNDLVLLEYTEMQAFMNILLNNFSMTFAVSSLFNN